jgi:hypothetical protein
VTTIRSFAVGMTMVVDTGGQGHKDIFEASDFIFTQTVFTVK